jgi:CRISPR system Cascade subunit CasD
MRYLRATLAAPLASFGGPAASGTRKDSGGPQRSAVIGLVCACLGIDRAATEEMRTLSTRLGVLVRMDRPGDALVDYHTAQSPGDTARKAWAKEFGGSIPTRRTLLAHAESLGALKTSLSEREYRTDVVLTLLLWDRRADEGPEFLDGIAGAMLRPAFTPTMGRKACPLSLPLAPWFVEATSVIEALNAERQEPVGASAERRTHDRVPKTYEGFLDLVMSFGRSDRSPPMCHADMDAEMAGTHVDAILSYRRDEPRDRAAWLFSERREMAFPMPKVGGQ